MYRNPADLPPSKNAKERQVIIETASKQSSDYNNPCVNEQKLSYKCLADNNYDKEICASVFVNYTACKDFWNRVQQDRKIQGLRPLLPWPEHRENIKEEYIQKWGLAEKLKKKLPPET